MSNGWGLPALIVTEMIWAISFRHGLTWLWDDFDLECGKAVLLMLLVLIALSVLFSHHVCLDVT